MKIKSLTIENFLVIGKAEIDLDNRGLLLIQGENEADTSANSNGAGKSSIVDAISWCLYGETARGISGDAVVNNSVGKDCMVEVLIDDVEGEYFITRYRKHHTGKNEVSVFSESTTLTKGTTKLTQGVIDKIIGCSYEVFIAAVYSGQEMMPDLPGMTDKQLKMIVEEAAGIERLQAAHEIALARGKIAQANVDGKKSYLDVNYSLLASNIVERDSLTINEKDYEVSRLENIRISTDQKELKIYSRGEILPFHPELRAKHIEEMKLLIEEINNPIEKEAKKLVDDKVKMAESEAAVWSTQVRIETKLAKGLKGELERVEDRIGLPCTECGKEYHAEDMADAKVNATSKLKTSLLNLKSCKEREVLAVERLNIALTEQKTFIDAMIDVSKLLKRHSEKQVLVDESNKRELLHKSITSEIATLHLNIKREQDRKNPYSDMVTKRIAEIEKLKEQKKLLSGELLELESKLETANSAIDVFGRSGVRAHILDTVTPFLNERTAEYLGTLTDGNITASWSTLTKTAKGDLREKFGIAVAKKHGSENFAGLSGGEKRKVRLSTAIALQDLVASRATKPIEFQFLDEIDDALDVSGLERLMVILEAKAKTVGTMLIISHNDLGSYVDQSITVINSGGISTIEDR